MADEFAVITATAPSAAGSVSYTSPKISAFRGAIVFISGDSADEDASAQLSVALFTADAGSDTSHGHLETFYRAGQSGSSVARHTASTSSAGTGTIRILDPATLGGNWAIGDVSDESDGFSVNWTDVSGLGGRTVKLIIVLFGGDVDLRAGSVSEHGSFFTGDTPNGLLEFAKRGSFGGTSTGFSVTLGGAVDDGAGGADQASVGCGWPTAADPVTCGQVVSDDDYNATVQEAGGVPTGVNDDAVTAFTSGGFTRDGSTVGTFWLGFKWADDRTILLAVEELDGTEGTDTVLSGLGRHAEVVVGVFVGVDTLNSLQTGAAREVLGIFVTDGTETHSISCAIDEGIDPDVSPTVAYSRYAASEWNVISSSGGTSWRATGVEIVDEGIKLDVVTPRSGTLFLWAVSRIPSLTPDPVECELVIPTVTRLVDSGQAPTPVELELVVPPVQLLAPEQPSPVVLALVVPAPTLLLPFPIVEVARPDFGPLYTGALMQLLPRGLAWPRRIST